MKLIAPSILSADFSKLGEEIQAVEKAGADWIHVDVMDGHFVPNITIGPPVVKSLRQITSLPLDVHLMIENSQDFVEDFVKAGANLISIHIEEGYHIDRTLNLIKDLGAKPGIAINPATSLDLLQNVLGLVDFVLIMTVNPGFGGQSFIPYCKGKITDLRQRLTKLNSQALIQIDGGVKLDNISELAQLGCDCFVSGSGIFGTKDYKKTITEMKKLI
jgi:ribulose-phosphate 3-epimerase